MTLSKQHSWNRVPVHTQPDGQNSPRSRFNGLGTVPWRLVRVGFLLALEIIVLLAGTRSRAGGPLGLESQRETGERALLTASGSFTTFLPLVERSATWRPFSDDSPWNVPIPPDPEIDPRSDAMVADLLESWSPVFWINIYKYAVPVWMANRSTPEYKVVCTDGYCGPDFDHVPIPDGAVPDPGSDAHMLILDLERQKSWDLWQAHKAADGSWTAGFGTTFDLDGDGVQAYGWGSARGSGFPLAAGLVYVDEVKAGHIRHALVMAYDWPRNCLVYPPASTNCGLSTDPDAIPIGARLQLDPSLNLDTLGLSAGAKVVARAMQEYGLYVGDNGWGLSLYAESFYGKPTDKWAGLLDENDLVKIPIDRLRVLRLGELRCDP